MLNVLKEYLDNMTPEQEAEMKEHFRDKNPKGWVSVEDALPMWKALDVAKGYSEYKVKNKDGKEFMTQLTDHQTWYHFVAKENGITHWWND